MLYEKGLVGAMVAQAGEEDAPRQQRYLQGPNVDVYPILAPGPCADAVGDDRCEESVEVEEEEGSENAAEQEVDQEFTGN